MVKGIAHSKTPNLQIQGEFHQTEFIMKRTCLSYSVGFMLCTILYASILYAPYNMVHYMYEPYVIDQVMAYTI